MRTLLAATLAALLPAAYVGGASAAYLATLFSSIARHL